MKKQSKSTVLAREFENFLADIESLMNATGDMTGEELEAIKQKMLKRVNEARGRVVDVSEGLAKRARKTGKSMNKEVHDEPWKAIGTGAALGLLLGLVFARR